MNTNSTREDARGYVTESVGEDAADFNINGIVDDVYDLIGTFNFDMLDRPDEDGEKPDVDYWSIVQRHDVSGDTRKVLR